MEGTVLSPRGINYLPTFSPSVLHSISGSYSKLACSHIYLHRYHVPPQIPLHFPHHTSFLHRSMQELKFSRSDGDPSLWPVCNKVKDGKRWERLESGHDLVTQYLGKLSVQLTQLFGRSCDSFSSFSPLPYTNLRVEQTKSVLYQMVTRYSFNIP